MDEILSVMRPLTHDERLRAKSKAAANLAGEQPHRKAFAQHTQGKYPPGIQWGMLALSFVVMMAAFAISTPRLYTAGFEASLATSATLVIAQIAGVAFFVLAETAQVVFSLTLAVVDASKAARIILHGGAWLATCIAVVGNVSVARPPLALSDAFFVVKWLDALAPPILVLGVAYVLKERILDAVQLRQQNEVAYQQALNAWRMTMQHPEEHEEWMHYYMQALRDALLNANARGRARDARKDLSTQDWIALLQREYNADAMLRELQAEVQARELQTATASRRRVQPKRSVEKRPDDASGGVLADAVQPVRGAWLATCPNCGQAYEKTTKQKARLALTAHYKRCNGAEMNAPMQLVSANGNGTH